MKIMKLTSKRLSPVTPIIIKKKPNTLYFNIKHGSRGDKLHSYTFGLDASKFKPTSISDELELKDDNYVLLPIYKNEEQRKDRAGHPMYFISTDDMDDHKNDYIILWEIPNKFYTNVEYTTSGNVNVLGEGKIGRSRGGEDYISPSPILEVYGVCSLEWTACKDGSRYKQSFSYDGEKWSIEAMTIINKESEDGERSCTTS